MWEDISGSISTLIKWSLDNYLFAVPIRIIEPGIWIAEMLISLFSFYFHYDSLDGSQWGCHSGHFSLFICDWIIDQDAYTRRNHLSSEARITQGLSSNRYLSGHCQYKTTVGNWAFEPLELVILLPNIKVYQIDWSLCKADKPMRLLDRHLLIRWPVFGSQFQFLFHKYEDLDCKAQEGEVGTK